MVTYMMVQPFNVAIFTHAHAHTQSDTGYYICTCDADNQVTIFTHTRVILV